MAENAAYDLAADPCGCPAFGERCFSSLLLDGKPTWDHGDFRFYADHGTAFPFLAAMVCSRSIQLEEDNHFQTFLGTTKRSKALFAKCAVLHIQSLAAVLLAIGNFAVGYYVLFYAEIMKNGGAVWGQSIGWIFWAFWGMAALAMWMGSLPLYWIHLFLTLRFSKISLLDSGWRKC